MRRLVLGDSPWKRRLLLGVLLLVNAPSTAHGQQLLRGDTIRVRTPEGRWTEATMFRLTSDTLWYQSSGNVSPISMDIANIQRPTQRDHRVAGAVIGGVTIGAITALIGHKEYSPRVSDCGSGWNFFCSATKPNPLSRGEQTALIAALGASVGGYLGYHAGKLLGHWETVELDQVMIGDGNLAVSMRIVR